MNKDKQRQFMKVAYFTGRALGVKSKSHELTGLAGLAMAAAGSVCIMSEITGLPWQVFCHDKPKIDKRRSKRYHRKYIAKLKSQGARIISPAR